MKKLFGVFSGLVGGLAPVLAFAADPWAGAAAAAPDGTPVIGYVIAILGGLAVVWVARKFIKITNRS